MNAGNQRPRYTTWPVSEYVTTNPSAESRCGLPTLIFRWRLSAILSASALSFASTWWMTDGGVSNILYGAFIAYPTVISIILRPTAACWEYRRQVSRSSVRYEAGCRNFSKKAVSKTSNAGKRCGFSFEEGVKIKKKLVLTTMM